MYRASIENRGDSKYHARTTDYTFVMDTEGEGANPVETLLASLCACIGHRAKDFLAERQIPLHGFKVEAEATACKDGLRLADISVRIDLNDTGLGTDHREELLSYTRKCKIHNSLKHACEVAVALK